MPVIAVNDSQGSGRIQLCRREVAATVESPPPRDEHLTDGFHEGSMMDVRWENYVWKGPRPVASSEIEQLEAQWGVELPGEYKRLIAGHQGMTPDPCVFKVGRGANVFSVLLTVTRDAERASYSIQDSYNLIRSHAPSGLYPFGKTPGGEYLC